MRKLLVVTAGVLTAGALAVAGLPILLVAAVLGAGQSTAGCPVPGGNPGGAFEPGYLDTVDVEGLSAEQITAAATIVSVGEQMQMPSRGIIVALAVASQESRFRNYANDGLGGDLRPDQRGVERSLTFPHDAVGTDHGSVNAFQQQYPWWGTLEELMNPPTAARKFYEALGRVPGWERMTVTTAGQRVQASAYPTAYADDETIATQLYQRLAGASSHTTTDPTTAPTTAAGGAPSGVTGAGCGSTGAGGAVSAAGWSLPLDPSTYTLTSDYGARWGTFHAGLDLAAPSGTPIRAVADGTVTFAGSDDGGYGNLVTIHTAPNVDTYYAHQVDGGIRVATGDTVTAGQLIGAVGTTGDSTGNHLHFEVRVDGATTDPLPFLQQQDLDPGTLP
ncbi:Peptidase family M23 [Geodermatophilus obscurus]|uniref:Peptidase family M23 n=1 Tax=Geodermatophilus obscurus TaxID=1861 RepID=A0A1M7V137_9ACTN|nr:M23 family metallopeptidase [Geodermatophilus obscurus]SHN88991.1 Peptidase family M23 [Geodermatophilus obscurus]